MTDIIKIKKGLDIKLVGKAEKVYDNKPLPKEFAIKPIDFLYIRAKLLVQEGDKVKAGTALFFDKFNEQIKFTSPVSGVVKEIRRGDKRKLLEVIIEADDVIEFESFRKEDPEKLSREEVLETLFESGVFPLLQRRPYAKIANPQDKPKAIFISAFDSSPLAPDNNFILEGNKDAFQTGINALKKLTDGNVHVNVNGKEQISPVISETNGIQVNKFEGPHPAGNVSVQIHEIDPLNKGEVVWYCYPQDVLTIGRLFSEGRFNAERIIALAGSEFKNRKYIKTLIGASIKPYIDDNLASENARLISGNVLTGDKISKNGFLGFYHNMFTAIPEGDYFEFFGWITPGLKKFSVSRTFFSWLMPNKEYHLDTNTHGGQRAFIMSGEYEKVVPMDIYPVHLVKSIMVNDIDKMEQLGIYEVAPEDFALCEVVCTSKINSQEIVRQGIDLMIKELG
jgi:Na+-transporting NADH:ubiquinone oxidoreductase subunit A